VCTVQNCNYSLPMSFCSVHIISNMMTSEQPLSEVKSTLLYVVLVATSMQIMQIPKDNVRFRSAISSQGDVKLIESDQRLNPVIIEFKRSQLVTIMTSGHEI